MKSLLILLLIVGVSYAGVGVVTPEIEAEARRLWEQFCDGQSEGGQAPGGAQVYCKRARGAVKMTLKHQANIGPAATPQDQVVFVQPPSYHYKHDIIVSGGGVAARKTVIYVKPAKNTHEVNVQDQTSPGAAPQKPTLFFLKGSHGSETDIGSVPVTTPPNTYLPPSTPPPTQPPATYLPPSQPTSGYNYPLPSRQSAPSPTYLLPSRDNDNECLDSPCLNGGTCSDRDEPYRYYCECPSGFWGQNCELLQSREEEPPTKEYNYPNPSK